jgi:hypothetical protein
LFGAAGLGAGQGIATATVYGVMVLAANLPGAAVLIASRHRRGSRDVAPAHHLPVPGLHGDKVRWPVPRTVSLRGGVGG